MHAQRTERLKGNTRMSNFINFYRKNGFYKYNCTVKSAELLDENFLKLNIHRKNSTKSIFLPIEKNLTYKLFSINKFKITSESNKEIKKYRTNVSLFSFFIEYIKNSLHKTNRKIIFEDIVISPSGPRPSRVFFYNFITLIRKSSAKQTLGNLLIQQPYMGWPEINYQKFDNINNNVKYKNKEKIVIACHIYYIDLVREISILIGNSGLNCDVIITICPENEKYSGIIKYLIPNAKIVICKNIGRDVYPFLNLLKDGYFDDYGLICKIHGKKSKTGGRIEATGDWWRRLLFLDLLGSRPTLDRIFSLFEEDSKLGMIGSRAFRCPGPVFSESLGWGANRDRLLDLVGRMGGRPDKYKPDFVAGTMFWVRREALEPLRSLSLDESYFEPETGDLREGPEHALERAFGASVEIAGFKIVDIDATECDPALKALLSGAQIT